MTTEPMTGQEFKQIREIFGSGLDMAKKMGVHPVTVSNWETGRNAIPGPARVLIRLFLDQYYQKMEKIAELDKQKSAILNE